MNEPNDIELRPCTLTDDDPRDEDIHERETEPGLDAALDAASRPDVECIHCKRVVPWVTSWKDRKAPDAYFCNARCAEGYEAPKGALVDLWQRETNAAAEKAIKSVAMHGVPEATLAMAASAAHAGASNVAQVLADIVQDNDEREDEDGADVVPITRQQRRAQERAAQKDAQSLVHVTKEQYDKLHRARIMLAALVRREGRVRIARRELELQRGDKLDVKVQENGDLMVTFKAG